MATPYKTSLDLIDAIKRRVFIPMAQITYSDESLLQYANEEMDISQVPSILEYHENFFLFRHDVDVEEGKVRYEIPARAIGNKFKDLHYVDENNNECKLDEVSSENRSFFQEGYTNNSISKFYIEGNDIVIVAQEPFSTTGKLRFTYFLRPNRLVLNDRAAISTAFVKDITINNAQINAGDTFTIGTTVFTAGTDFAIGATSIDTATNLTVAINMTSIATANNGTVSTNIIQVTYRLRRTSFESSNELAIIIREEQGIQFSSVPEHIVDGTVIDLLQTRGGHKSHKINVEIPTSGVSGNVIYLDSDDVPNEFVVGDYVCQEYECIIPQIPDDLHISLVERTCAAILSSMSDLEGLKFKNEKIKEIEMRQGYLIDNRAEGNSEKINNINSHLRNGKRNRFMRKL